VAGAVLIGEAARDQYRARAVGLVQTGWGVGWGAAALASTGIFAFVPEAFAWTLVFQVGVISPFFVFRVHRTPTSPRFSTAADSRKPHASAVGAAAALSLGGHQGVADGGAQRGGYLLSVRLPI
jgi:hypothetical protein